METNTGRSPALLTRLFFVVLILLVGAVGFAGLKKLKKPPQQKAVKETVLAVKTIEVNPVDNGVSLKGYGEVVAGTRVSVSAEVSGKITHIHQNLKAGETLPKGEVLLTLDDRDHVLEYQTAVSRLEVLNKDLELARRELERVSALYRKNKVGTLSALEQAEKTVNSIINQISQVKRDRDSAMLRKERSVVRAPFACRITEVAVEAGEYVNIGSPLVTIVDDSTLELEVALDSRDAAKWLRIAPGTQSDRVNWFGEPESVECRIFWTEDTSVSAKGVLRRIVRFDHTTRTLVVLIALEGEQAAPFPITEGMFCQVKVPGKDIEDIYIVPRHSVTQDSTVYRVVDNRLKTTRVKVLRMENGEAFISEGLEPGDTVITTRLENPLEGVLVRSATTRENQ